MKVGTWNLRLLKTDFLSLNGLTLLEKDIFYIDL